MRFSHGPIRAYPAEATLHGLFEEQAARTPSAIAAIHASSQLTYSQLDQAANLLAQQLCSHKPQPNEPIGLLLEPGLGQLIGLIGILKSGGGYLPLDPHWPIRRLEQVVGDSRLRIIVSTESFQPCLEGHGLQWLSIDALAARAPSLESTPPATTPERSPGPDRLAYVLFTSGSSGTPKGVMISHAAISNRLYGMQEAYRLTRQDVVLQKTPLSFDVSVWEIFWTLMTGARLVIPQAGDHRDLTELISLIQSHRVTTVHFVPPVLDLFLQHPDAPRCESIRRILCGGEALMPKLQERFFQLFDAELHHLYGPTEASIDVTAWPCQRHQRNDRIPIGRPVPNVSIYVLDAAGQPVSDGEAGEIHIAGKQLAMGYLNRPDLTATSFLADPFSSDSSARMYRTGDQGRWRPDGSLEFLGRLDDQIKLRGIRVELNELELVLNQHPDVIQCAVCCQGEADAKQLIAYVVARVPHPDLKAWRAFIAERLPAEMLPAQFQMISAMPLTNHGKIDRQALQQRPPDHAQPSDGSALGIALPETQGSVTNPTLATLRGFWQQVLGSRAISDHDDFFLIGGDSLKAMRVVLAIAQQYDARMSLKTFFSGSTLAEQSLWLDRHIQDEGLTSVSGSPPTTSKGLLLNHAASGPQFAPTIPPAQPLLGDWPAGTLAFSASFAQSRLWFLQQVQPDLTAYHIPLLWRLQGELDVAALENALAGLIERHPTLRTSFQLHDGNDVVQILHPPAPFQLHPEPLSQRDPEAVIEACLQQEAATPFDLSSGILLRARLLAVTEQEHILLLNHHHIASDVWSQSVLTRDLTALYNAHHNGHPPALQPLGLHYHDYAVWQRQLLSGSQLQTLHDYWIPQLTGLEPLELPTDHPRPATPTHRGADLSVSIEPSLLQPFEELCRAQGATLQMGLLALVALLLHRTSRQDDIAIGVPIWGRNHPDLEPLIGFFVNTLPIRCSFESSLSFRQLLDQVAATSLAAYDHQDLPFEQIVEALNLPRDTSRNPLVQVILQFNNLEDHSLTHLHGLEVDSLNASGHAARFDLEFFLSRQQAGGIAATITYSTDLFSADRIQRLSSHLLTLLASAIAAPDAPATSLNLLPDSERQLIESWQHGPSIAIPDLCIHQLFEQQVDRTPEAIALVFEDQSLTYSELNARANQLAHHLISLGVGPDVIVAVCLDRSIELIVSLLAILKAGGAYLPLDPGWPQERQSMLLRQSGGAILIQPAGAELLDNLGPSPNRAILSPRSLAYVSYTSGSTGIPKGVAIEHRSILRLVHPINGFHLGSGATVLQLAPVAFDAATLEIWGPLLNGGTLVIAPPGQLTPADLAALLRRHSISTLWLTAGLFHAMVDSELDALAGLRQLLAGGDVLSPEHVRRLLETAEPGHALINGYGPTENTTFTACHLMRPRESAGLADQAISIGRPVAMTTTRVLDPAGQPCPIGVPGELHIGGHGLARGYLNNPELTAETFIPDPFSSDPTARLYRSGDLASWNADGTLAFHGRIDLQIKLRGFSIEPGEIEANLLAHPAVAQAVVLLRKDDPANPRLIAYWVPQQGATSPPGADDLRAFLNQRLPDYMVPAAFVVLEAFPLTTNGKLDRRALPAPSFAGDLNQRVAPSTPDELQLHSLWAEVLGHQDFGITDNFWLLGGHSLAAARLAARIEQTLGTSMPLALLFRFPTLAAQAAWLSNTAQHAPSHLVSLQPLGSRAPLYILHGLGGTVGHFAPLARALAPQRPVFGLQASPEEQPLTREALTTLADTYAQEILDAHPGGPIHLMGYSAGGWYAYAVAAALLQRQAPLGMLAILDSNANPPIHRRLGLALFSRILRTRLLPNLLALLDPPPEQRRSRYALHRLRSLNNSAALYLRLRLPGPRAIKARLNGNAPAPHDPFFQLLMRAGKPPRLPLQVDLFSPQDQLTILSRFWRFYATRGVRSWPLFQDHFDFFQPHLAPQLAQALEHALQHAEESPTNSQQPHGPAKQAG